MASLLPQIGGGQKLVSPEAQIPDSQAPQTQRQQALTYHLLCSDVPALQRLQQGNQNTGQAQAICLSTGDPKANATPTPTK